MPKTNNTAAGAKTGLTRRPSFRSRRALIFAAIVVLAGITAVAFTRAATPAVGLSAAYFNNATLSGSPVVSRVDTEVNYNWGAGSPAAAVPTDNFSARWTGTLTAPASGVFEIFTASDNGVRVWIGDQLVVNSWTDHPPMENSGSLNLVQGTQYPIKVEYFEIRGNAMISLQWSGPGIARGVIPRSVLSTTVSTPVPSPTPSGAPGTTVTPVPTPTPTPAATPVVSNPQLKSVSWWESQYNGIWSYNYSNDLPLSKSSDSWDYYNLAYSIDDPVAMYLASGKTKYLDQSLVYINNMVNNAKASSTLGSAAYRDSYLGWASHKNGSTGQEEPLYESYAWRYVTRALLVIKKTPALYGNPTYKAQYDKLLAFTEKNIFDKWYARGIDNIYRSNTNMASHWAYISMDLSLMTTDATRLAKEKKVFDDINNHIPTYGNASLHGQMKTSPVNAAAYFWNENWGSTARPGQDVSHANAEMAYITEAYDLGMGGWTRADISKFVVTLDKVVWKKNGGPYAASVDGSGSDNGWFIDGWMKLGRYDATLQQRFETHTVGFAPGNGALNAKRLGAPQ
jgi:uncharacterized protein YndB with AHSA1/START domain